MQNLLTAVHIESEVARIFANRKYKNIADLPEKNLLALFDYLIPDWKWMESKVFPCSCNEKRKVIFEEIRLDLIQQIIEMLKDEGKSLFHFYLYRTLHQLIHEFTNDGKNVESVKDTITASRPIEYDRYLEGITDEFKQCIKLTLVGLSYPFDYTFEEKVTDEKFELLEYLFRCQVSRFELRFREYIEKEKRNLGAYHRVSLKPMIRLYYNIARNAAEKDPKKQYQFIKCQELIAHSFPEVERNSFLITKFYEQRHLRIFDDSKKYDDDIKKTLWPIILCRVATRLKVLGFPTGIIEDDMSKAQSVFKEEFSNFRFMINDTEMNEFIGKHDCDFVASTNVSNFVKEIQANVGTLMNLNEPDNRIAIFGRNSARPESLFELILSIPEMATEHEDFIEIVWDKFDLIKTPEMLQVKNHLGKSIFDYTIASNDPWNLIKFIRKLKFHKYFDHEFKMATGLNLFEYYVKLSMLHTGGDNRLRLVYVNEIILYLLEEYDVTSLPIENALDLTEVDYVETFGIRDYKNISDPCPRLCLEGKIAADYMLCLIVAYCRPELLSPEFKRRLTYNNPIVELLLMIISGPESECVEGFAESLIKIEDYLANLCVISEDTPSSSLIALFNNTMFLAAMVNDRRNVIDKIFESENFAAMDFRFPSNMKTYDGSYYATMKLIDSNYGDVLSKYNVPKSWISAKEFGKKLLDSRITLMDNRCRIEINTTFLINSDLKRFNVETDNDLVDCLFLRDDTKALQFYYENDGLKEFITHPAIAIYVGLKWFKYKRMFVWNFWIFVLQLSSYSLFVFGRIGKHYENCDSDWCINPILQNYLQVQTSLTIVYMVGREVFQFWHMNKRSFCNHFSSFENIVECMVAVTIACTFLVDNFRCREILVYLACFNIFAMMVIMITMFPYSFMYFHMQMFRKVAKTFVTFFLTFTTLLFTFVIIFAIIFNLILPKRESVAHKEFVQNFDNIGNAGLKVILMLSGEYSIEPFDLNIFQLIVFSLFVFITYILFNLIVGLTIDDVQKLRENANKVVVRNQIETIVKTDRIFRDFYSEISKDLANTTTACRYILNRIRYSGMKFLFNRYLHLHKIDKIYIDLATLNVEMFIADAFRCPVQFSFWRFDIERFLGRKNYQIDDETFDKINKILNDRCDEEYEMKETNKRT